MTEIVIHQSGEIVSQQANHAMQAIASMVLDTVGARSKRDYGRALGDFLTWHTTTGQTGLDKATVNAHIAHLNAQGVPASSINQRLAAIRKLAKEAADNGLIEESQAIGRVGNIKIQSKKLGN